MYGGGSLPASTFTLTTVHRQRGCLEEASQLSGNDTDQRTIMALTPASFTVPAIMISSLSPKRRRTNLTKLVTSRRIEYAVLDTSCTQFGISCESGEGQRWAVSCRALEHSQLLGKHRHKTKDSTALVGGRPAGNVVRRRSCQVA